MIDGLTEAIKQFRLVTDNKTYLYDLIVEDIREQCQDCIGHHHCWNNDLLMLTEFKGVCCNQKEKI